MALYRFLFAPVLLAVAVLLGARERTGAPPPRAPAVAEAPPAAAAPPGATPIGPTRVRRAEPRAAALH